MTLDTLSILKLPLPAVQEGRLGMAWEVEAGTYRDTVAGFQNENTYSEMCSPPPPVAGHWLSFVL